MVQSPIAGRIVGEAEADDISRKRDSDKSRVVRYRMSMLSFAGKKGEERFHAEQIIRGR